MGVISSQKKLLNFNFLKNVNKINCFGWATLDFGKQTKCVQNSAHFTKIVDFSNFLWTVILDAFWGPGCPQIPKIWNIARFCCNNKYGVKDWIYWYFQNLYQFWLIRWLMGLFLHLEVPTVDCRLLNLCAIMDHQILVFQFHYELEMSVIEIFCPFFGIWKHFW